MADEDIVQPVSLVEMPTVKTEKSEEAESKKETTEQVTNKKSAENTTAQAQQKETQSQSASETPVSADDPNSSGDANVEQDNKASSPGLWGLWGTVGSIASSTVSKVKETTTFVKEKSLSGVGDVVQLAKDAATNVGIAMPGAGGVSGGVRVVVTSTTLAKVNAVRWALEQTFGPSCQVRAAAVDSHIAAQPIGFDAGRAGAMQRADLIEAGSNEIIISIENFITEVGPSCWFDMGHVFLRDDVNNIELHSLSQAVRVQTDFVDRAKKATPEDYEHIETGFSVTCGEIIASQKPHLEASDWHNAACGLSRQQLLHVAVRVILGEYRRELTAKARSAAASLSAITKDTPSQKET
eukprot:m.340460 g.340460  ORF g.340460 m.340460 type:complete len:353 (+) comp19320_c0_seq1:185-1243(+)